MAIRALATKYSVPLHCDGARLYEASPYYEQPLAKIAELFDSIYISFYKVCAQAKLSLIVLARRENMPQESALAAGYDTPLVDWDCEREFATHGKHLSLAVKRAGWLCEFEPRLSRPQLSSLHQIAGVWGDDGRNAPGHQGLCAKGLNLATPPGRESIHNAPVCSFQPGCVSYPRRFVQKTVGQDEGCRGGHALRSGHLGM